MESYTNVRPNDMVYLQRQTDSNGFPKDSRGFPNLCDCYNGLTLARFTHKTKQQCRFFQFNLALYISIIIVVCKHVNQPILGSTANYN